MKRIILSIMIIATLLLPTSIVEAKTYTYESYKELNVRTAMIVGDYVFSLDKGYSPTLQDIMVATRTITMDKPVHLYYVMDMAGMFYFLDMYSGESSTNTADFKVFTAKYLYYKNNVKTATIEDYIEI